MLSLKVLWASFFSGISQFPANLENRQLGHAKRQVLLVFAAEVVHFNSAVAVLWIYIQYTDSTVGLACLVKIQKRKLTQKLQTKVATKRISASTAPGQFCQVRDCICAWNKKLKKKMKKEHLRLCFLSKSSLNYVQANVAGDTKKKNTVCSNIAESIPSSLSAVACHNPLNHFSCDEPDYRSGSVFLVSVTESRTRMVYSSFPMNLKSLKANILLMGSYLCSVLVQHS